MPGPAIATLEARIQAALEQRRPKLAELVRDAVDAALQAELEQLVDQELELRSNGTTTTTAPAELCSVCGERPRRKHRTRCRQCQSRLDNEARRARRRERRTAAAPVQAAASGDDEPRPDPEPAPNGTAALSASELVGDPDPERPAPPARNRRDRSAQDAPRAAGSTGSTPGITALELAERVSDDRSVAGPELERWLVDEELATSDGGRLELTARGLDVAGAIEPFAV